MKKKQEKYIYYDDELNDEFSTAQITPKAIDGDYRYVNDSLLGRAGHFFWYNVVAKPIAKIYLKMKFSHTIIGRDKIDKQKMSGFFLFGNHTQAIADALIPTMICRPCDVYVIVHPNNVSMPVLGRITPSLGALPLPDNMDATRNFIKAVEMRLSQGYGICIYPEAHIWPYYTGIRPFTDKSFYYPVKYKTPVYCFTNTYQTEKPGGKVKIVTYVDGPFYPEEGLPRQKQQTDLRDKVYKQMTERAKNSNVDIIRYVRRVV